MRRLLYGSIRSGGVRINYYRTGDEKPPVVLLHGLGESGLSWNRVPVALEPEFDVVMVDARGHGFSESPDSGYSPQDHAGDVLELITSLKLNRPALVGHHFGAETAALAAAQAPELVRALVLEDPPWPGPDTEADRQQLALKWVDYLKAGKGRSFDELEGSFAEEHPDWHSSDAFQWVKARQLASPHAAKYITEAWPEWTDLVSRLAVPGLVISGEPELGAQLSDSAARQIGQLWKQAQVERIPGAGHHVHRQQYRTFLSLARRYLRRVMVSA